MFVIRAEGFIAVRSHHAKRGPKQLTTVDSLSYQGAKRSPPAVGDRNASQHCERQGDRNQDIYGNPAEVFQEQHDESVVHGAASEWWKLNEYHLSRAGAVENRKAHENSWALIISSFNLLHPE